MKVCFISHTSQMGGAERALLELIGAIKKRGVKCYVILPRKGPIINELKRLNVKFDIIPWRLWMGKPFPLWQRLGKTLANLIMLSSILIARKIRKWHCDLVYTNSITVCVGAFAAKMLRLPHIWHIHEVGFGKHGMEFYFGTQLSLWVVNTFSNICIVNSKYVERKYKPYITPSKFNIIYQSVTAHNFNIENILPIENAKEKFRCVIVGHLHEAKGQKEAIRSIAELRDTGIVTELIIVGDGDPIYRMHLHELVAEMKLEDRVKFAGYAENPLPVMQNSDVVLMCSRYEAFGRVTVEAMKVGKPVIGARSGGTMELIQDGINGFLYKPGDYKNLAEKIKYFHKDSQLAEQMGLNGYRWASKRFTQDRYGEEVLSILNQVVNTK